MAKAKKIAKTATKAPPKKKRNKLPPYKAVNGETTIGAAIGDAFSEFRSLRDEMGEIADNMCGANMEHMPKYEMAEAAQSELYEHTDAEPSDVPKELAEQKITYIQMVNRKKGRGPSRDTRCSNAQSLLQAAIDALDLYAESMEEEVSDIETVKASAERLLDEKDIDAAQTKKYLIAGLAKLEELVEAKKSAAEELSQELQEHVDFTIDFPGFYG